MTKLSTSTRLMLNATTLTVATLLALASTGCGTGLSSTETATTTPATHSTLGGRVMGGQQPVIGATIQLYAVNTTTLRGASTPLLTSTVTTDSTGSFSITGLYTCPIGALVYIASTGGDAGAGANSAINLISGLGPCSALNASTFIVINELSTTATVFALAPFMADFSHVGAPSASLAGITNAFLNIRSLVNIGSGTSPGLSAPANATIPSTLLNSIANVVSACVNGSLAAANCTTLFSNAPPTGGTPLPSDTSAALLNIATHPGANVSTLFGLQVPQAPFQPSLATAPNDFTVAIKLTGNSLSTPSGLAIDASGNAWVTNETGTTLSEFSPTGAALAGTGSLYSFSGAQALAFDAAGALWVANTGGNNAIKIVSGTVDKNISSYISGPVDLVTDARNNVWIANLISIPTYTYAVTQLNSAGTPINTLAAGSTLVRPTGVAIDLNGNLWISNSGPGTLVEFSKVPAQLSPTNGFADTALQSPGPIATDSSGNAWVLGQGGPELSGFNSAGTPLANSPIYAASLTQPSAIATDAANTIWITNGPTAGSLSGFTAGTGLPITSLQSLGSLNAPTHLAVDLSGSLWTTNSGDNSVTIFLGLAASTITPLVSRTQ